MAKGAAFASATSARDTGCIAEERWEKNCIHPLAEEHSCVIIAGFLERGGRSLDRPSGDMGTVTALLGDGGVT